MLGLLKQKNPIGLNAIKLNLLVLLILYLCFVIAGVVGAQPTRPPLNNYLKILNYLTKKNICNLLINFTFKAFVYILKKRVKFS
jgi:hypothetical protein